MTSPLRNVRNYNPDRNIDKAFADKDFDHGKFLSARELRAALQELDIIVTREEAEVYLKDYDLDESRGIDIHEFREIVGKLRALRADPDSADVQRGDLMEVYRRDRDPKAAAAAKSPKRKGENARPQTARATYAPPPKKTLPPGVRRQRPASAGPRPASAGPRAKLQNAKTVDDRLEAMTRALAGTLSVVPAPRGPVYGNDTDLSVQGASVATAKQLREQNEILRQANAYMQQQQQAAMLRLAAATRANDELEQRAQHAEKTVKALTLAMRQKHTQLVTVTRELQQLDRAAATQTVVRSDAVRPLAKSEVPPAPG
jgi:hypothetical protein